MQSKLPVPENEKERLKTLRNYKILDTLPDQELDDLARMAASICDTPMALITLIEKDRQWFKSNIGMDGTETKREESFCQYAIMGNDIYEVPDASQSKIFADNPFVTGNPNIRFYAGAPLITPGGYSI